MEFRAVRRRVRYAHSNSFFVVGLPLSLFLLSFLNEQLSSSTQCAINTAAYRSPGCANVYDTLPPAVTPDPEFRRSLARHFRRHPPPSSCSTLSRPRVHQYSSRVAVRCPGAPFVQRTRVFSHLHFFVSVPMHPVLWGLP